MRSVKSVGEMIKARNLMNSVMEVNSLRHVAIPCIGYTILAAVGSQKPRSSVYSRTIVSTQYCYKRGLDLYRSQRFNQSRCVGRNRFRDTPVNILTRRYRCNFYGTAFLFSLASSEAPGGGKKKGSTAFGGYVKYAVVRLLHSVALCGIAAAFEHQRQDKTYQ